MSNKRVPVPVEPPPRPREIHRHPCAHCPSAQGAVHGHDPESIDLIAASRDAQLDSVFRCSWRPQKLCKGWCDAVNVTEEDLKP